MIRTVKELQDAMTEGFVMKVCSGQAVMVPVPRYHRTGLGPMQRMPGPIVIGDEFTRELLAVDWNRKNPGCPITKLTREGTPPVAERKRGDGYRIGWEEMELDGSGDYYHREKDAVFTQ